MFIETVTCEQAINVFCIEYLFKKPNGEVWCRLSSGTHLKIKDMNTIDECVETFNSVAKGTLTKKSFLE